MRERGDTTVPETENIISLTHTAEPGEPRGLKGITHSQSLSITLTYTRSLLFQYRFCHYTSNVATLSPTLSTWSFANTTNTKRDKKRAKRQQKDVNYNDSTVFQVSTEGHRSNVTVGSF